MSLSSSSSDTDDSEDEFLGHDRDGQRPKSAAEREAIIRRKLLESFYGKKQPSSVGTAANGASTATSPPHTPTSSHNNNTSTNNNTPHHQSTTAPPSSKSLDSPNFNPSSHTHHLLTTSSVSSLLSTDETLALDIRQLNSTMQTLVYENYSKFIDATDAVRSIGRSVDASSSNLSLLSAGIDRIESLARDIDEALEGPRRRVAETVTVRRHLSNLDSLLKLPDTLEQQIGEKKYRLAAKSYGNAVEVLAQHSEGFESLAKIEGVCRNIVKSMGADLGRMIERWSGVGEEGASRVDLVMREMDYGENERPRDVKDIFECAGTLAVLGGMDRGFVDEALTEGRCRTLALLACSKFLEMLLEENEVEGNKDSDNNVGSVEQTNIIPQKYLTGILECATLYSVTFSSGLPHPNPINDFISDSFSLFLSHTRMALLSLSVDASSSSDFTNMTTALTNLVLSVRELATGLALPEVGVDMGIASHLVEQTVEVTESMIRRYVSLQFNALRTSAITEGIIPFLEEMRPTIHLTPKNSNTTKSDKSVLDIVRMASVALDDVMQLLDGVIHRVAGMLESAPVEKRMVTLSVEKNARRFAVWLANVLEMLVGGDMIVFSGKKDEIIMLEVEDVEEEEDGEEDEDVLDTSLSKVTSKQMTSSLIPSRSISFEDAIIDDDDDNDPLEKAYCLIDNLSTTNNTTILRHLLISMAQLCHLSSKTVVETINRSISTSLHKQPTTTRRSSSNNSTTLKTNIDTDSLISTTFQTASQRLLALYANDNGNDASHLVSRHLSHASTLTTPPQSPGEGIIALLSLAKSLSNNFADVFGGERRSNPPPGATDYAAARFRSHYQSGGTSGTTSTAGLAVAAAAGGASVRGLQIGIDRMFTEKTPAYSFIMESVDRESVLCAMFVVTIRNMMERCRLLRFGIEGWRQMMIDAELLALMIPHYVGGDKTGPLFHLLDEFVGCVGERCGERRLGGWRDERSGGSGGGEDVTPMMIVRRFFDEGKDVLERFAIVDELEE